MSVFFSISGSATKINLGNLPLPVGYDPATHQIGLYLGGQSNMKGITSDLAPAYLQGAMTGVYIKQDGFNVWAPLEYQVNNLSSGGNSHGCELSLAYKLKNHFNTDLYIVKQGVNSAPIYNDPNRTDFSVERKAFSTDAYKRLKTDGLQLKAKIEADTGKIPVIFFVWIQGEGDANDAGSFTYYANFEAIVNELRLDGCQIDYVVLNAIKLDETRVPGDQTTIDGYARVKQAQIDWVNDHSTTASSLDMLPYPFGTDKLHFTGAGQIAIGEDVGDIIISKIDQLV